MIHIVFMQIASQSASANSSNETLTLILSIIGTVSGLSGLCAFLCAFFSERVKIKFIDISELKGFTNVFFPKRIEDGSSCVSRNSAYAFIQISNNSKLPICITNAKFKYNGVLYSSTKDYPSSDFVINDHFKVPEKFMLLLPRNLKPFEYVEGMLCFLEFPDIDINTNYEIHVKLETQTNRNKSYFLNINFNSEKYLLEKLIAR